MRSRDARATALLLRITMLRIVLVPVVMGLIMLGDDVPNAYPIAAAVFVVAAFTDFVDGYLARRWALTTTLGSFLDTTADKLLVVGALVSLIEARRASAWVAAVIVGRELVIMGLRGVVASDGAVMVTSIWGKLKANAQFIAITLAILRPGPRLGPLWADEWAMMAAAAITIMSAWDYLARWSPSLSMRPP
ncbi:MAG TPA: CDP-diacylglycerol--glycerol-3-phosphate 3-phosphatidyltransferase [Actinomycetota bacterium]|nr:CDP-diacylglycerol--glycerol-3-phosphate 3-phosphatidyltransferase [Actinomycetota bacterium]